MRFAAYAGTVQFGGILVAAGLCVLIGFSCVQVDGGAVEAGWDLRFPDGRRTDDDGNSVSCTQTGMDRMVLVLQPMAGGVDPCVGQSHCQFSCSSQGVGTTDFVIPPAEYSISLHVVDKAGKSLASVDGVVTPGPVVRQVSTGEITSLNVNLIIVSR